VSLVSFEELQQLVSAHGYWVVALIVGLESMGLPLPGETILVLAAIYAATEPSFNVWVVIAVAAFGAIVGDNVGYWLGLRYGYALLVREEVVRPCFPVCFSIGAPPRRHGVTCPTTKRGSSPTVFD
jgi:membrane protein DedA with SNARE-associated domain